MSAIVYPRGFIGFNVGVVQEKPNLDTLLQSIRGLNFNNPVIEPTNSFSANPDVSNLWQKYISGSNYVSTFEFREKILVTALKVFNTNNFYQWCVLQNKSPYLTATHKKFLEDTFSFIETGKRSLSITTWLSLVRIDAKDTSTGNTVLDLDKFFCLNRTPEIRPSFLTIDIINRWVSTPNGFDDLLVSLVIFFGSNE